MFSAIPQAEQSITTAFRYPTIPDLSLKEKLMLEKECSGMYFSGHMLDTYDKHLAILNPTPIAQIGELDPSRNKEPLSVAGILTACTVKNTRKNEKMAFFTLEDRGGEIECLAFPTQYQKYSHLLRIDAPLFVKGNLSLRDGEEEDAKILVSEIVEIVDNSRADSVTLPKPAATQRPERPAEEKKESGAAPKQVGANPPSKIFLRVPDREGMAYKKALNLVEMFEGTTPVFFYDASSATYFPSKTGIQLTDFVYRELVLVLGEKNVVAK